MERYSDYALDIIRMLIGLLLVLIGWGLGILLGGAAVAGAFGGTDNMSTGIVITTFVLLLLASTLLVVLGRPASRATSLVMFVFITLTGIAVGLLILKGWKWFDFGLAELQSDIAYHRKA